MYHIFGTQNIILLCASFVFISLCATNREKIAGARERTECRGGAGEGNEDKGACKRDRVREWESEREMGRSKSVAATLAVN